MLSFGWYLTLLVVEPTPLKNMSQIGNLSPRVRVEKEKYWKPPPSNPYLKNGETPVHQTTEKGGQGLPGNRDTGQGTPLKAGVK